MNKNTYAAIAGLLLVGALMAPTGNAGIHTPATHIQECVDVAGVGGAVVAPTPNADHYICLEVNIWTLVGPVITVVPNPIINDPLGVTPVLFAPGAIFLGYSALNAADPSLNFFGGAHSCQDGEVQDFMCFNTGNNQVHWQIPPPGAAGDCVPPDGDPLTGPEDFELWYMMYNNPITIGFGQMGWAGGASPYFTGFLEGQYPSVLTDFEIHAWVEDFTGPCDAYTDYDVGVDMLPGTADDVATALPLDVLDGVEDTAHYGYLLGSPP